ncbi:unnamed protein product [Lactuca virosa]|uniref:Uncharacterized protein n=1 Tax=Lactuca virosa TaxID=75947 RepID=A0AAU9PU03_9ASTR|nr:unnamed protein product [Lactuca virosa]
MKDKEESEKEGEEEQETKAKDEESEDEEEAKDEESEDEEEEDSAKKPKAAGRKRRPIRQTDFHTTGPQISAQGNSKRNLKLVTSER